MLVVDDERPIADLIGRMLREAGLAVQVATSPNAAIEFASRNPDTALALLDWRMPELTGEIVFDQLSAIRPGIKAIVTSGDDISVVKGAFGERKVDGFLRKPFTRDALVAAVRSALANEPARTA